MNQEANAMKDHWAHWVSINYVQQNCNRSICARAIKSTKKRVIEREESEMNVLKCATDAHVSKQSHTEFNFSSAYMHRVKWLWAFYIYLHICMNVPCTHVLCVLYAKWSEIGQCLHVFVWLVVRAHQKFNSENGEIYIFIYVYSPFCTSCHLLCSWANKQQL